MARRLQAHYQCRVCGKKFEGKRKAEGHEETCGIESLSNFMDLGDYYD